MLCMVMLALEQPRKAGPMHICTIAQSMHPREEPLQVLAAIMHAHILGSAAVVQRLQLAGGRAPPICSNELHEKDWLPSVAQLQVNLDAD